MRRRTLSVMVAILVAAGCGTERVLRPDGSTEATTYHPMNLPENVIANLEAAYRNRDIEAFAELLAPEFTFRFQPGDVPVVGRSSWGREEEIESTRGLFESERVKDIEIRLDYLPAERASEPGLEHTMRIRVDRAFLRVIEESIVHEVPGHPQDFFLRREHGNHPNRWVIVEWRDLPPA